MNLFGQLGIGILSSIRVIKKMAILSYVFLYITALFLNAHVINCAVALLAKRDYNGLYFHLFAVFLLIAIFCGVNFGYTF